MLYNSANAIQQIYLNPGTSGLYALATMRHVDGVKVILVSFNGHFEDS